MTAESGLRQTIKLDGKEYFVVSTFENYQAEDSFIHRSNKLRQFRGNGEAKKHVGTYSGENGKNLSKFFEYDRWGIEYLDPHRNEKTMQEAVKVGAVVQQGTCCFSRANLLHYLEDAKQEYFSQEQVYHQDISSEYARRYKEVEELGSDYIWFSIYDASDGHSKRQNRAYIRSDDRIWQVWRKLVLPKISYLSILKLAPVGGAGATERFVFYFQIQLDYHFRSFVHPSLVKAFTPSQDADVNVQNRYRQGADKYRREVLEYMGRCPFTLISDERLLIASHIKPYTICMKESREDQALDYLNGLALSPTYDKLFDQGYITFSDSGELICSALLSPFTWSKLAINPTSRKRHQIIPEKRELYLEYHRKHVFQGAIEELT